MPETGGHPASIGIDNLLADRRCEREPASLDSERRGRRQLSARSAIISPFPFHSREYRLKGTLQSGFPRRLQAGTMSDDSFIREVNEEIRQDQARAIWDRFGPFLIGAAIVVVVGTAAWVGYDYWRTNTANASGDRFSQALTLANEGKNDEAIAALEALEADGYGAYPLLARMRAATVLSEKGDFAGAVKQFDEVAADTSIPAAIRDMARLRAALLLVDHGSQADVAARVESLTAETSALRHSAREALGLAAWKEGKFADALVLFDQIAADSGAPRNNRERATLMSELIRGSGAAS
jgi:hypothetical protein